MAKKISIPEDLLGPIEQLVVKAVMAIGDDEAYGTEVFEAIRSVYPPISFGSVYTALERLTWKGYLESKMGEPDPERRGRARRRYQVTGLGKKVLEGTLNVYAAPMSVKKLVNA